MVGEYVEALTFSDIHTYANAVCEYNSGDDNPLVKAEREVLMLEAAINFTECSRTYGARSSVEVEAYIPVSVDATGKWAFESSIELHASVLQEISDASSATDFLDPQPSIIDLTGPIAQDDGKVVRVLGFISEGAGMIPPNTVYSWNGGAQANCGSTSSPAHIQGYADVRADQIISDACSEFYTPFAIRTGRIKYAPIGVSPKSFFTFDLNSADYPTGSTVSPFTDRGKFMTHVVESSTNDQKCFNPSKQDFYYSDGMDLYLAQNPNHVQSQPTFLLSTSLRGISYNFNGFLFANHRHLPKYGGTAHYSVGPGGQQINVSCW